MPGNFYRTLRAMLADGLIEESPDRVQTADHDDERRRYFRLTPLGEQRRRGRSRGGSKRRCTSRARRSCSRNGDDLRCLHGGLLACCCSPFRRSCGASSATT